MSASSRVLAACLAAATILASAGVAGADVSDADISAARDRLISAQAAADTSAARLTEARAVEGRAATSVRNQKAKIAELVAERDALRTVLEHKAVQAYKHGGSTALLAYFTASDDAGENGLRRAYLERALAQDDRAISQMASVKEDLDAEQQLLDVELDKVRAARARVEAESARLYSALDAARREKAQLETQKAAEDAARAAAARRALAAAQSRARESRSKSSGNSRSSGGTQQAHGGGGNCPVAGAVSFSDSYGAPRSGGRSHRGVDMMAASGTPIAAITSGTVVRTGSGGLGGLSITIQGDNGQSYYYAHNSRNTVSTGQRVSAGQIIGYVGDTGNAAGTPHLHFEVGGGSSNPTGAVSGVC